MDDRVPVRIRQAADEAAKHAADIERLRRIPEGVLGMLIDAGCFRMFAPHRYGGDDLTLTDALAAVECLSAADASVGWTVAQAAVAQQVIRYFPEETSDEVYADGPDVLAAGAVAPKGRASRDDAGWTVTGEWPFVTGVPHARWVFLQCLTTVRGKVGVEPGGLPRMRLVLLRRSDVEMLDTWDTTGLRGTASHHVRASRVHCPAARTCSFDAVAPLPGPCIALHARDQGGLFVAAVAVGIARGAAGDVAELARLGKRPAFSPDRLADAPVFQDQFGEAEMLRHAARALLYERVDAALRAAAADGGPDPLARAMVRATGPLVVDLAHQVVRRAFALAGGSAVYSSHPLQRRLRDVQTAQQHFTAGRDFYRPVGALLAGTDPGQMLR